MNIENIENKLSDLKSPEYQSIIALIIDAVRDYPLLNLDDIDQYFEEVKTLLDRKEITEENLKNVIEQCSKKTEEQSIWVISSLTILLEALSLMNLHKISFEELKNKLSSLD